ncbi:mucin-2 [Gracilaria domingensis]|nr:mucin-2 [Gracilaria domingensis]
MSCGSVSCTAFAKGSEGVAGVCELANKVHGGDDVGGHQSPVDGWAGYMLTNVQHIKRGVTNISMAELVSLQVGVKVINGVRRHGRIGAHVDGPRDQVVQRAVAAVGGAGLRRGAHNGGKAHHHEVVVHHAIGGGVHGQQTARAHAARQAHPRRQQPARVAAGRPAVEEHNGVVAARGRQPRQVGGRDGVDDADVGAVRVHGLRARAAARLVVERVEGRAVRRRDARGAQRARREAHVVGARGRGRLAAGREARVRHRQQREAAQQRAHARDGAPRAHPTAHRDIAPRRRRRRARAAFRAASCTALRAPPVAAAA